MEVEEEERAHEVGIPQRRIVMVEGQTSQGQRRSEPMVLDIPPEQDDREASIIDIESDDEQEQDGEIQLEARVYRDIQGNTRVYGKHGYAIYSSQGQMVHKSRSKEKEQIEEDEVFESRDEKRAREARDSKELEKMKEEKSD